MSYKNRTIIDTVKDINNTYFLPSIQRKFVWEYKQIENLFDSIMAGYPIGTFLFWAIDKGADPSHIDEYTFYKFISDYSEKDSIEYIQEKLNKPSLKEKVVAVLDGQQRLSSIYCALRGSYAIKTAKKLSPNEPYPKRELYFNVLYKPMDELSNRYEFKFLIESEAKKADEKTYWVKVKDLILWADNKSGRAVVKQRIKEITRNIKANIYEDILDADLYQIEIDLEILWDKLVCDEIVTYYEINKESLDEVLDIFVRVNSAGTPLSKSDLVFSTIVANWEDGREKIENLIEKLNEKGDHFKFDKDFIITLCLALMDFKQKFEFRTFTKENVNKVANEWDKISQAIHDSVRLLVEFGFNDENLTAYYIVIPVAYYLFKGQKNYNTITNEDKNSIRKFLIYGMVKKIFSAGVDGVLTNILAALKVKNERTGTYELKVKERFDFETLKTLSFQGKTLNIEYSDLDEILNLKKGALSFMVLSLLYPNIKYGESKWHQDHIHPKSRFEKKRLAEYLQTKNMRLPEEQIREWVAKVDTIVNLQLLTGVKNQEKGKLEFHKWVEGEFHSADAREAYFIENYIDAACGLEIKDFEAYYRRRKELLRNKLIEIFDIDVENAMTAQQEEDMTDNDDYTIVEVAKEVLKNATDGMTIKEICKKIIKNNLYQFGAQNPENVLTIQIRRACEGVTISNERLVKIFKIVRSEDGKHYYGLIQN